MFCVLFQQLIASITTEFFLLESVLFKGLNNLSAEDEDLQSPEYYFFFFLNNKLE